MQGLEFRYPYTYIVEYWSEEEKKNREATGIVFAENCSKAAEELRKYYIEESDDDFNRLQLVPHDNLSISENVIQISDEIIEEGELF